MIADDPEGQGMHADIVSGRSETPFPAEIVSLRTVHVKYVGGRIDTQKHIVEIDVHLNSFHGVNGVRQNQAMLHGRNVRAFPRRSNRRFRVGDIFPRLIGEIRNFAFRSGMRIYAEQSEKRFAVSWGVLPGTAARQLHGLQWNGLIRRIKFQLFARKRADVTFPAVNMKSQLDCSRSLEIRADRHSGEIRDGKLFRSGPP